MASFYTLRIIKSDITVLGNSNAPYLYVKVSFGDESRRTRSSNELPPRWNEVFPITFSGNNIGFTIKLMKEGLKDTIIGFNECSLDELLKENGEDVCVSMKSKIGLQPSIFLCLQPSDEMKNAEIALVNLACVLLDVHPDNENSFVENVSIIFDTAKDMTESDIYLSLENIGYEVTAFADLGDSIADASPTLKLAWCMTTSFCKIIATQPRTDRRVKDLVKNLMSLFLIFKETPFVVNPHSRLDLAVTNLLEFIVQCNNLIQGCTRRSSLIHLVKQNKKAAIEDLEDRLASLKKDLEYQVKPREKINEELREILEKKLQPKRESGRDRQTCLKGTRIKLLEEIDEWVQDVNASNVFFLLGHAGTGKSTVATTVAEKYERLKQLGSRQYFLRGKSDPSSIFRTIAYGLAKQNQTLAQIIKAQLDDNELETASPDRAFEILLYEPLQELSKKEGTTSIILTVLDALDECGSGEPREPYIRLIKKKLVKLPPNYRFLITSRLERENTSFEELEKLGVHYKLLDHDSEDSKEDVFKYIQVELTELKVRRGSEVDPDWPRRSDMKVLSDVASGLFIWASTAVRLIESGQDMEGELEYLVNTKSLSLRGLYENALDLSLDWDETTRACFSKVFSLIMFSKKPLTAREISGILGLNYGKIQGILNSLRSLVVFKPDQPVRLYHTSLYEYLISEEAHGKAWFIDEETEKTCISLRCFEIMEGLRFNICDLKTSYKLNKNVPGLEERVKNNISASLLYTCRYWALHLREAPYSHDLRHQLESFALNRLLFWIEVLSLTSSLYTFSLRSLDDAITWIGDKHAQLSAFLQDAQDQLTTFIEPISQSSPHLYMSLLPLTREDSIVSKHYTKDALSLTSAECVGNKPRVACNRQIVVGSEVKSISYSPDSERIVSESGVDVEVWDARSGKRLLGPLQGHSMAVTSVAFSADGEYIASGSEDKTIRVWNALTGEIHFGPLVGHSERVNSVAFSVDRRYIASGSNDGSVRMWDSENGALIGEPLRGHSSYVFSVTFSPDGHFLASGSWDSTIIVWDVKSRKMISDPFKGHYSSVYSLSFSPDSIKIASGSWDSTIRVWEVLTGKILRTFTEDGLRYVNSVAYSSDGKYILSGSRDKVVRLWNAEDSDVPPRIFEGHTDRVESISFAPSSRHFASGSRDGLVRVWDVEGGVSETEFNGQKGAITAISVSPKSGKYLVSGSEDGTVCVWNTESGDLIKGPLRGNTSCVTSVTFSSNENHFASGSADKSIRIWNMIDDECIIHDRPIFSIRSLAFSPDSSHLASSSDVGSIQIWSIENGSSELRRVFGLPIVAHSICYSSDGKRIVSGSADNTIRIWSSSNGSLLSTLEGHSHPVNSVFYSIDGLYIVSGSGDNTIRVWNAETGQAVCDPITGHTNSVSSVCFSPDGKWIISGSQDKTVCVWNISTGCLFSQFRVSSDVKSVASFPTSESNHIKFASSSWDGTIYVWSVNVESEGIIRRLEDDGWLTGNDGNLLIWIPPDFRKSIIGGPCTRTLNTRFSTNLCLSINRGYQWTACIPSSDTRIS